MAKKSRAYKKLQRKIHRVGTRKRITQILWSKRTVLQRAGILFVAACFLLVSISYGISYWYLKKHQDEPLQIGTTFIPRYARHFGLDPKETMAASIDELGIKRFRLVSYWNDIEKVQGTYDYSELDWQFRMAEEKGAKISLSLGLRQPRWPECHIPNWALNQPRSFWEKPLMDFIETTVNRYKDSSALYSYQVENEFFMTIFGECPDFSRDRLIAEYDLVKRLDPSKPIVVTRSNNWGGVPIYGPTPDYYGVAVYKRVYDYSITHRYFEYPYPPWFYGFLAGAGEIIKGKPMIIHELQMEPWMPDGYEINRLSDISEQEKSMNAERLAQRFDYAADSGLRIFDTWGVEWWYWRKVKAGDSSLWDTAQDKIAELDGTSASF